MENKELYPKGTVKQTEDFALRQKIKKIVGENVEEIIKEETINAFEELGYEEKDGYMFVIAAGGKDGEEKEVGKGVKEGKLNVTVSTPKMLNMGAVKPVSYMQKVTTFGGKKIVSEIYLEIIDKTVHVEYKNTEASSFHQSSEKDTYAPNKLNKTGVITGLENEKTFKKDFKDFFKSIAEAEAKYLIGTKIANDDKIEKNMNDSIVKENKYNMKLSDLLSSSFEDAGNKIENLVKESLQIEENKETGSKTPETPTGEPTDKKLVIGSEEKIEEEGEEKIEEMNVAGDGAGSAGQIGYLTPHAFTSDGKTKAFKANKDYTQVQMNESIKETTYGMMRTPRAHLTRQSDGTYKVLSESTKKLKTPYTEEVKMEPGHINTPEGMTDNYTMGMHGKAKVNSKEELNNTGHGNLSELEKMEESYKKKLELNKRKFSSLTENEEKGINKRYIITEKLTKEEQSKRWKELYENDCFCNVKDKADTVSRDEYESAASKEFASNNPPLESSLSNTPFSGEEKGFIDVPKARGSMIVFRLSESDVKQNKMYLVDHFTNKLVLNPLFKSKE
jgi:hypothetical protein